jgi:hypothetical protein
MKGSLAENIREIEIAKQIEGVGVGKITGLDEDGNVFVDFPGNTRGPIAARITGSIKFQLENQKFSADQSILLAFEDNNPGLPVIIDVLHSTIDKDKMSQNLALDVGDLEDITLNGKRMIFDAKEEIVLRCGKANITLTRAGKVLIRGAYLLNRSSGVNSIKGGSVQIN